MQGLPNLPAAPNTEVSEDVRRLNNLAGNARFRDFAGLRSGRDQFSRLRGEALAAMVHEASRVEVGDLLRAAGAVGDDEATDKALRWALRGLRPHLAVRKVMVDRGIAGNASGRRTSG
jgi:ribonuclease HI